MLSRLVLGGKFPLIFQFEGFFGYFLFCSPEGAGCHELAVVAGDVDVLREGGVGRGPPQGEDEDPGDGEGLPVGQHLDLQIKLEHGTYLCL